MNARIDNKRLYLSEKILEALKFASVAHKDQLRNDTVPFISHPVAVGLILSRAGFEEKIVIAGILHDVIEDTKKTHADIAEVFGKEVADLVQWVSYDQSLPIEEGKAMYRKQLSEGPVEACAISAADLMANRTDTLLAITHPRFTKWRGNIEKMIRYDTLRLEIIKRRLQHPLVEQLEALVTRVHQTIIQ